MKNQLTPSSVKMTRKFDQQLYAILAGELNAVKITKNNLMANLNFPNEGVLDA
jgi:hypothetical protein